MPDIQYPIQEIMQVVEGEGPRTGEVVTLVRFGMPDLEHLHLKPIPRLDLRVYPMTADQMLGACMSLGPRVVHLGGEDPCLLDIAPLLRALHRHFSILLDTFGQAPLAGEDRRRIDFLSISPRPGLPFDVELLQGADEVRLYYSLGPDSLAWREVWEEVLASLDDAFKMPRLSVVPREMTPATILAVLTFCTNHPRYCASIPLYRLVPEINLAGRHVDLSVYT
jgi:organic radical activating enzyme